MATVSTPYTPRRCVDCGSVAWSRTPQTCCGYDMTELGRPENCPVPSFEDVLRSVFGMSRTELELCVLLMEEGGKTAGELAERMDLDRSLVNRRLNHLLDIQVVEQSSRLVRGGGRVNVYEHADIEDIEVAFEEMLCAWMGEALYHIHEGMVREKEAAVESARDMMDTIGDGGHSTVYHE